MVVVQSDAHHGAQVASDVLRPEASTTRERRRARPAKTLRYALRIEPDRRRSGDQKGSDREIAREHLYPDVAAQRPTEHMVGRVPEPAHESAEKPGVAREAIGPRWASRILRSAMTRKVRDDYSEVGLGELAELSGEDFLAGRVSVDKQDRGLACAAMQQPNFLTTDMAITQYHAKQPQPIEGASSSRPSIAN